MKDTIKMIAAIVIFAVVACAGLAVVYQSTSQTIATRQKDDLDAALNSLFPKAQFDKITGTLTATDSKDVSIGDVYTAKIGGQIIGVAINASGNGFSGTIATLVGVGIDGKISGVKILQISDTPGLGANAASDKYFIDKPAKTKTFYGQFAGMSANGKIAVQKDGGDVVAITASTITSRAVSLIVKNAAGAGSKWLAGQGAAANGGSN
jgi:electron transport complex protein RnfG